MVTIEWNGTSLAWDGTKIGTCANPCCTGTCSHCDTGTTPATIDVTLSGWDWLPLCFCVQAATTKYGDDTSYEITGTVDGTYTLAEATDPVTGECCWAHVAEGALRIKQYPNDACTGTADVDDPADLIIVVRRSDKDWAGNSAPAGQGYWLASAWAQSQNGTSNLTDPEASELFLGRTEKLMADKDCSKGHTAETVLDTCAQDCDTDEVTFDLGGCEDEQLGRNQPHWCLSDGAETIAVSPN